MRLNVVVEVFHGEHLIVVLESEKVCVVLVMGEVASSVILWEAVLLAAMKQC